VRKWVLLSLLLLFLHQLQFATAAPKKPAAKVRYYDCDKDCVKGFCKFKDCHAPKCRGGACHFLNCTNATCAGKCNVGVIVSILRNLALNGWVNEQVVDVH